MEAGAVTGGLDDEAMVTTGAAASYRAVPETPYSGFDIALLLCILTIMCICGVLVSELEARTFGATMGRMELQPCLTDALVNAIGRN